MTPTTEFKALAQAYEQQFNRLPAGGYAGWVREVKPAPPACLQTLLRPEGVLALRQPGEPDVVASPWQHWLYRRAADTDPLELEEADQTLAERHQAEAPLRQAWEADLAARYPGVVARVDRSSQALAAVARDQPCLSELIAARLECAPDQLGRLLQPLREAGWLETVRVVDGLKQVVEVLRLTPAGQQQARQRGLAVAEQLALLEPGFLAEHLATQKVAGLYLRRWPAARVRLADSAEAPEVLTPRGILHPDLVVEWDHHRLYVEVEAVNYNRDRLSKKLDRYLAHPAIATVWVIAERDDAETWWHVPHWFHFDLVEAPMKPLRTSELTVHFTHLSELREQGHDAPIWRTTSRVDGEIWLKDKGYALV
jgi:DNA-binding MarR family transcriptional regulator